MKVWRAAVGQQSKTAMGVFRTNRATWLRLAIASALVCVADVSHAEPRCDVELTAKDGAVASLWVHAIDRVRRGLTGHEPSDCRAVDVQVDASGADVIFTTVDGRRATRRIKKPRELESVVDALVVRDDASAAPPAPSLLPAEQTASPTEALPPEPVLDEPPPRTVATKDEHYQLSVGATGGAKLAWPGNFATPVFRGGVGIAIGKWDAGAFFGLEPSYAELGADHHLELDGIGGGATFGRHTLLGHATLLYGISASVFSVEETLHLGSGNLKSHIDDAAMELRFGLYAGALVPITGGVRVHGQLLAEASPGAHVPSNTSLVAFPTASLGLVIGMDFDLP